MPRAPSLDSGTDPLSSGLPKYTTSLVERFKALRSSWHDRTSAAAVYSSQGGQIVPADTWEELELSSLVFNISHGREPDRAEDGAGAPMLVCETARAQPTTAAAFLSLSTSLARLPLPCAETFARQEAMKELLNRPELATSLGDAISDGAMSALSSAMTGVGGGFLERYSPETVAMWYSRVRVGLTQLECSLGQVPRPTSSLLCGAIDQLHDFLRTDTARIFTKGARISARGISAADEAPHSPFFLRYRPIEIHPVRALPFYAPPVLAVVGTPLAMWGSADLSALGGTLLGTAISAGICALAYTAVGGASTKIRFHDALVARAAHDVPKALGAAALVCELMALNRFTSASPQPTAFMRLIESDEALFCAQGMGSPLHHNNPHFVLNDAEIKDSHPTLVMGPNSAGKTTWIRALSANWLLAMLGSRSFVQAGSFSPISRLIISAPKQSVSQSRQGRFGEELAWLGPELARGINSRCVVAFDEIGSGTAEPAAAKIGVPILRTLEAHGCRTIVATHNSHLRDALENAQVPIHALHPEILVVTKPDGTVEADSSHRIMAGFPNTDIPPESGAWRVLSELGLSPEALRGFEARAKAARGLGSNGSATPP